MHDYRRQWMARRAARLALRRAVLRRLLEALTHPDDDPEDYRIVEDTSRVPLGHGSFRIVRQPKLPE